LRAPPSLQGRSNLGSCFLLCSSRRLCSLSCSRFRSPPRSVCIRFSAGCISLFSAELSPWYFLQACADRSDRYSLGLQLRSRRRLRFGGFCPPFSQPSSSSLRGAAQQAGLQAGLEVIYSQQVVLRAVQLQRVAVRSVVQL